MLYSSISDVARAVDETTKRVSCRDCVGLLYLITIGIASSPCSRRRRRHSRPSPSLARLLPVHCIGYQKQNFDSQRKSSCIHQGIKSSSIRMQTANRLQKALKTGSGLTFGTFNQTHDSLIGDFSGIPRHVQWYFPCGIHALKTCLIALDTFWNAQY